MCGIVGLINYQQNRELLDRMNEVQYHRGPDYGGCYWNPSGTVGIAMRRLSIVDLASGQQPMTNEDGSIELVYNGEIYNAPTLRKELVSKGHVFKTSNCDTEVLVHLYEEYGIEMLSRLNGMFAFALYDIPRDQILIARDQCGIKPLHYYHHDGRLAFASELKSLVTTGISNRRLRRDAIWQYLSWQCVPAPLTIYEDVEALPAAHYLVYDIASDALTVHRYWNCIENRRPYTGTAQELREYVREHVEQAIERWTMSDVPLACSLSGGLDSSIIAALVARGHELHTYTLGFPQNADIDERSLARQLADQYGTQHTEIVIDPHDFLNNLDAMIDSLDAPYAGGVPSWFVFQGIAGHEKVVFNGTGGDELFGNYQKWLRYEHPKVRLQMMRSALASGEDKAELLHAPCGSIYHKYMTEGMKRTVCMDASNARRFNTNDALEQMIKACPSGNWRDRVPYVDFQIQLPEEFLFMLDRFSMHFSIEARTPFLDRELVECILGIPASMRTRKYDYKYLLRESLGDLLPEDYLHTACKRGFVMPYTAWMRGELREELLSICTGPRVREQGIFTEQLEQQLIMPFMNGRDDLSELVWTIYMFQKWYLRTGVTA